MDNQKQQVAAAIKEANNVLVTVSANPSVDQLAACIGLTVALNKLGKHATAVFSGQVPSTIEFLQPEKTLEKNTDSLRDFIIALDKSKADKLRYKVEDRVVKIFITPYKTSISEKDLEFSQGDFNVDIVIAIGVHVQPDLDQAITAHGRILHDATVVTMNVKPGGQLGGINWLDAGASSLSELGTQLVDELDKQLIDGQIATAFLTGIVAETERFSNAKTSPQTMSVSAELMAAGANQQLVATKLEEPAPEPPKPAPIAAIEMPEKPTAMPPKNDDGTLEITHDDLKRLAASGKNDAPEADQEAEAEQAPLPEPDAPQIHINDQGELQPFGDETPKAEDPQDVADAMRPTKHEPLHKTDRPYLGAASHRTDSDTHTLIPASGGSPMSATVMPDGFPTTDALSLPDLEMPLLERQPLQDEPHASDEPAIGTTILPPTEETVAKPAPPVETQLEPEVQLPQITEPDETLTQIEQEVHSPHLTSLTPYEALPSDPAAGQDQPATHDVPDKEEDEQLPETPTVEDARTAVERAINAVPMDERPQHPIHALNDAARGGGALQQDATGAIVLPDSPPEETPAPPAAVAPDRQMPNLPTWEPAAPAALAADAQPAPVQKAANDPTAPPQVPPPMLPPAFPGQ